MKNIRLISVWIFLSAAALHAAVPVEVTSRISEVTVFLRGAQVVRQARVQLTKGTTTFAFEGLPVNMDERSIQATGEGNFIILSLSRQVNYLAGQHSSPRVKVLQDTLEMCEEQLANNTALQSVMQNEEELLLANMDISGNEKGVLMNELKTAADFFRSRLTEIKKEQLKLAREATQWNLKIENIKKQLNAVNADLNKPTSEILVTITSNENSNGYLRISYIVNDAGWTPVYDVRVKDVQSPVILNYNAKVTQNSGEDWENVPLKLSTANPRQRGDKPELQPWYIDFVQPVAVYDEVVRTDRMKKAVFAAPMAMEAEAVAEESLPEAQTSADYSQVEENQTTLEFNIKIPYDIPSDNKQTTINIQENSLPATYEYYCAPKLDTEAFLIAHLTGWENYNLLSGEINLFFEGTYVGKSNLNVRNTNDTLDLSLGRDKGIVVTRIKQKDFTEVKTIGSNKTETYGWEITLRNNKKQPLGLRIEDQLPVSMNKDIAVEPLDVAGGNYNKVTGMISWKINLDPSSEKKLRLVYSVKYPRDQQVYVE